MFGSNVAWKLYLARQYGEAELEFGKLRAWHPDSTGSYVLASIYLQTGRQREAIAELRESVEKSHRGLFELMFLGHALGVSGERAEAKKVLDEMQALSQQRYVPPLYIAIVYEGLGDRGRALEWFEKAVAERSSIPGSDAADGLAAMTSLDFRTAESRAPINIAGKLWLDVSLPLHVLSGSRGRAGISRQSRRLLDQARRTRRHRPTDRSR
jgi:tetratricopeptide (TPR) repeat protein